MRRKVAMQRKYMIGLGIAWAFLCLCIILLVKSTYFVGITEDDVEYVSQVTPTDYTVKTIRQNTQVDGSMTYNVTFYDESNVAPEFAVDMFTLPTDMALGNVYSVQWLQVTGVVDGYTRSKDLISIQFAEQELDSTAITQLRADIFVALSEILDKRLNVLFYPFCIVAFLILFVGEYIVVRISAIIVERTFKATEWDYLQESIDKRTSSTVRSSLDFTEEMALLRKISNKYIKTTRRATNAQNTVLQTHVAKKTEKQENMDIVVQKPARKQTMQRAAKKLKPVQEDIIIGDVNN